MFKSYFLPKNTCILNYNKKMHSVSNEHRTYILMVCTAGVRSVDILQRLLNDALMTSSLTQAAHGDGAASSNLISFDNAGPPSTK